MPVSLYFYILYLMVGFAATTIIIMQVVFYRLVTPMVSIISPVSGPAEGGTKVQITGSNLDCALSVAFGTNTVSNFKIVSDKEIIANSPPGIPGSNVDVTVITSFGTTQTVTSGQFTYNEPALLD